MTDRIIFITIFVIISLSFTYRRYAVSRRDVYLLRAGLICTLSADFCMLVIYNNLIGLLFFICVQTIYFFRYLSGRMHAAAIIPALLCVFIIISNVMPLPLETRLAVIYALALVTGALTAFIRRGVYPYPNRVLIPLGMLLFMLCDINVMLINVLPDGTGKSAAHILIWVFYLPSQTLLSVSGKKMNCQGRNS